MYPKVYFTNYAPTLFDVNTRNKLAIDDWREESRSLQQKKHYEALRKGVIKGNKKRLF